MPRSALRVLCVFLLLAAVPTAAAATAAPARHGVMYEDHLHNTNGHDWHVQLQSNKAGTGLTSVVLHAEACDVDAIVFRVPIAADGSFSAGGKLDGGKATWAVKARFVDTDHATGTWSAGRGKCSVTDQGFTAHDGPGHYVIGNQNPYAPDAITGPSPSARKLRKLQTRTATNARRWDTPDEAVALGYKPTPAEEKCPGVIHYRRHGASFWGKVLNPAAPQALVYWCAGDSTRTLVAAMYRAPPDSHPNTFGNLIQWHIHGGHGTWMTHVWLVPDPVAAFATCVPFPALGDAGISYEPYGVDIPIDGPCPDTDFGSSGAPPPTSSR
jgi:hypothetical protein